MFFPFLPIGRVSCREEALHEPKTLILQVTAACKTAKNECRFETMSGMVESAHIHGKVPSTSA
jgi:hypothetical protein